MIREILHRPEGKPQRLTEAEEARADDDVGPATQAKPAERWSGQRPSTPAERHACERSPNGRLPPVPKVGDTENENLPESFDALASHLNERFARLAADIEEMRKELRDAEEQSEQLKRRLLNGKLLSSL